MLTELGELEQNLVYGDMGSAELIKFLQGEYTCPGGSRKGQRRGSGWGRGRALAGSVPDGLGQWAVQNPPGSCKVSGHVLAAAAKGNGGGIRVGFGVSA
jgi:hypothetical protein